MLEKELESQTRYKKVQVFILRNIKMFKRKILDEINKWKNSLNIKKRALVIQGLRQIGKTTVVLNYCKKNYENVIALIPTQHYNYAHSNFNTQTINIDFQYKCLVVKMQNIFKNLKSNNEEHIYSTERLLKVLDVGLRTNEFEKNNNVTYDGLLELINKYYPTVKNKILPNKTNLAPSNNNIC